MIYAMDEVLRRYGSTLVLHREGRNLPFRGFLQSFRSKSLQNARRVIGPLGQIPKGQYVLLAPLEPMLQEGDRITLGQLETEICRLDTVMLGDRAVYRWGLCEKRGGV